MIGTEELRSNGTKRHLYLTSGVLFYYISSRLNSRFKLYAYTINNQHTRKLCSSTTLLYPYCPLIPPSLNPYHKHKSIMNTVNTTTNHDNHQQRKKENLEEK